MVKVIVLMKQLFARGILEEHDYTSKNTRNSLMHVLNKICDMFPNNSIEDLIVLLGNKEFGILDYVLGKKDISRDSEVLMSQINMSGITNFIPNLTEEKDSIEKLRLIIEFLEENEMNSVTDEHRPIILGFRKYLKQFEGLKKNFDPSEFINAIKTSSIINKYSMQLEK